MLQCHRSKRLKVLQDPGMAFENLQAFRGALRDGKTFKRFAGLCGMGKP